MAPAAVVEFISEASTVLMRVTPPWGTAVTLEMDPDEAREFSNKLGSAIHHVSRSDDMTEQLAAWMPDPAPEAEAPAAEAQSGSAAAQFGSWLPPSAVRAQFLEDVAEAREARQAERARADRAEQAHDRAVASYMAGAAARGEHVAPMDAVAGNVGRGLADVLADASARMDATQEHADERFYGEPVIQGAQRSGWPGSAYEADRQLQRGSDLHRDLVAYKARRNYPAAIEVARSRSERAPMIYR